MAGGVQTASIDFSIGRTGIMFGQECRRCHVFKARGDFTQQTRNKSGLEHWCRPCRSAYAGDRVHLLYGMSKEQHEAKRADSRYSCEICGKKESSLTGRQKRLHTDHDHATGAVRGMLCPQCNVGLGYFGDDVDRLLAAVSYMRRKTNTGDTHVD